MEEVQDEDAEGSAASTGGFAPGNDADYFVEEDEEGRFFGGGLTAEQKEILNILSCFQLLQLVDQSACRW